MNTRPIALFCARCARRLTGPLQEVAEEERRVEGHLATLRMPPGTTARMAQGRLSQLSTPTPTGLETREACNGADAWSVNPDDAVEEHLDWIHLADQGCCGSHGLEGPNRRCVCGAVLGTEWSDCGIVAEVRFDAAAVAVQTDGP